MDKKTKNIARIIAIAMIIAALYTGFACQSGLSKNHFDNNDTHPLDGSFTDKYWVLTDFKAEPGIDWDIDGEIETDILAKLDPCDKDDAIIFRNDNKIYRHLGSDKCDEEEEVEKENGTWKYMPSTKELTMTDDQQKARVYVVAATNANTLVLRHYLDGSDGRHLLTATYKIK